MPLLFLFIVIPIIELFLLTVVSARLGVMFTLALVILTGTIGFSMVKRQGLKVYGEFQNELRSGQMPKDKIFEGLMLLVAGVLLITPGILTDILGFALLTEGFRKLVIANASKVISVKTNFKASATASFTTRPRPQRKSREDADYEILDD